MPGRCGSGTDDRVGCGISILGELKEQLVRHGTGGLCLEAGGWVRWLWEQASFRVLYFSICFHHNSLPPHLLLHLHSAGILTNNRSLASISLTPSVGSPCLHGPGSLLLEGFSLCLIPCLNTSRSECFWSLVVFPKTLPFLFKPSRQISLPIPSKAV